MIIRIVYYNNYATYLGKSFHGTTGDIRGANDCLSNAGLRNNSGRCISVPEVYPLAIPGSETLSHCYTHTPAPIISVICPTIYAAGVLPGWLVRSFTRRLEPPRTRYRSDVCKGGDVSHGIIAPCGAIKPSVSRIKPRSPARFVLS